VANEFIDFNCCKLIINFLSNDATTFNDQFANSIELSVTVITVIVATNIETVNQKMREMLLRLKAIPTFSKKILSRVAHLDAWLVMLKTLNREFRQPIFD